LRSSNKILLCLLALRFSCELAAALVANTIEDTEWHDRQQQLAGPGPVTDRLPFVGNLVNASSAAWRGDVAATDRYANALGGEGLATLLTAGMVKMIPVPTAETEAGVAWPLNRGFVAGEGGQASVLPGQVLDRYGGTGGSFLSPAGTPAAARSLAPGVELRPLNSYQVVKPFEAGAGRAAPAFGQPGLGLQFDLGQTTVQDLINSGHLQPMP
jgi:hypothetical protein